MNKHFWIVHLALVGLLALALANVAVFVTEKKLDTGSQRANSPTQQSSTRAKGEKKGRSFYSVIQERNIFRAALDEAPRKETEQKVVTSDQTRDLARTPLEVKLRGTAVRESGDSFAVIEDKKTRKEDLYHIGDKVLGEAQVMQIFADRVVLIRNGQKEVLELFEENQPPEAKGTPKGQPPKMPPGASSEPKATVPEGGGVRQLAANRWSVSREEIESVKANMSELMTQVRIVPNFNEGKPDGFKLLSIKRGSLFNKLGLQDGDVIRRINGNVLENPMEALELYQGLESGRSISLDVLRRGKEQTLNYEME